MSCEIQPARLNRPTQKADNIWAQIATLVAMAALAAMSAMTAITAVTAMAAMEATARW